MRTEGTPEWLDRDAWPHAPRFVDVGEGRLHYVDVGEGPAVLFVHGTPTWSFEYRHLIAALSKTHRCIAVDHLGFGLSDRPREAAYTPEAHAVRLKRFVEALGLERFTLVVHDYGGPIGLPLALDGSGRVEKVVVMNSWAWSFEGDRHMEKGARIAGGGFGRFLYRRLNFSLKVIAPSAYGDKRKLTKAIHRHYLSVFPDAWSRGAVLWPLARALLGSSAHYRGLWEQLGALRSVPVLIVWGMKDTAFQPYLLERWREGVPHAKVVELADAGHWPHEEAPEEVVRALGGFVGGAAEVAGAPVTAA